MSETEPDLRKIAAALTSLDGALCNFLNAAADPFTPVRVWDDETKRNFKRLGDAYDHCHRVGAMRLGEVPPFLTVSLPNPPHLDRGTADT